MLAVRHHRLAYPVDELERDGLVEKVAHRVDEDDLRAHPLTRNPERFLIEHDLAGEHRSTIFVPAGDSAVLRVALVLHVLEPERHGSGVAVLAPR